MKKISLSLIGLLILQLCFTQKVATPDQIYGQLFVDVQMNRIFPDNKTFVDCIPKRDPAAIVRDYKRIKNNPAIKFSLQKFVEENYLNEERFAIQFAGGRFRIKQWGKNKIVHALKQKQVSAWCIKKAIQGIDPDDYQKTLLKLAAEKWKSLDGEKNSFSRMAKTTSFLLMRGFEAPLIREALKNTSENE